MINNTYAKTIEKVNEIIAELESLYKSFKLITILPISSGYLVYYSLGWERVLK